VRLALFSHHPQVVLRVLVQVLRLDGLPATSRILGEVGVSLIIGTGIGHGVARIAGQTYALRSRPSDRLLILLALRPEWPSARTLVQDSLHSWEGMRPTYMIQRRGG
jgi:hypothetical protein